MTLPSMISPQLSGCLGVFPANSPQPCHPDFPTLLLEFWHI